MITAQQKQQKRTFLVKSPADLNYTLFTVHFLQRIVLFGLATSTDSKPGRMFTKKDESFFVLGSSSSAT